MANINITLTAFQLGFIVNLTKGNSGFFPLFVRIREACDGIRPASDTEEITVSATEGEIVSCIVAVSRSQQGIAKPVAEAMRESLGAQILAGIQAEGEGEEAVLDASGAPTYRLTSPTDSTPIAVTQPKPFARILAALTSIEDQELSTRNRMVNEGWAFLTA